MLFAQQRSLFLFKKSLSFKKVVQGLCASPLQTVSLISNADLTSNNRHTRTFFFNKLYFKIGFNTPQLAAPILKLEIAGREVKKFARIPLSLLWG